MEWMLLNNCVKKLFTTFNDDTVSLSMTESGLILNHGF